MSSKLASVPGSAYYISEFRRNSKEDHYVSNAKRLVLGYFQVGADIGIRYIELIRSSEAESEPPMASLSVHDWPLIVGSIMCSFIGFDRHCAVSIPLVS
jgi:hypothetical protein